MLILIDTRDLDALLNTGEYYGTIADYISGGPLSRGAMPQRSPMVRRGTRKGQRRKTARRAYEKKRKPSAYAKAYGVIYKQLKKKHPRASFGGLSKKAHAATRKKRGLKKGRK